MLSNHTSSETVASQARETIGLRSWILQSLLCTALIVVLKPVLVSANETPTAWQLAKCRFYEETWRDMLAHFGPGALSDGFVDQNERFIAAHCLERIEVCPKSEHDLAVANALTLGTMNGDVGGTFLPFRCD